MEGQDKGEPRGTDDFFRNYRTRAASQFNNQYARAKRQDWWTFSKMVLVISVSLILMPSFILGVYYLISIVTNLELPILLSITSIIVPFGQFIFLVFGAAFLAAIGSGVSIATGRDPVLKVDSPRGLYVIHLGKFVMAIALIVGYYYFFFNNVPGNVIEFILVIMLMVGLFLLPMSLILWGYFGLKNIIE